MPEEKQLLDISWESIVRILFVVIVGYLLYTISEILVWIVFALIISIIFNPIIDYLRKAKVPRAMGASFAYLSVFGIISLLIYALIPGLYEEVVSFYALLPNYIERIAPFLQYIGIEGFETLDQMVETLHASSEEIAKSIFSGLSVIFGGLAAAAFIIGMAFFFSLEGNSVERAIKVLLPEEKTNYALFIWKKCRDQVSRWFLVRIVACLFVGVSSFIVFYLFDVNYALLFAIMAGVFNIVPFIGPLVAGMIFFIMISLESFVQAFFVILAFIAIQGMEGIISPLLSKRIMGVSPALVFVAIIIGGSLWGVLGAILAIPLLGIIFEFFKAYLQKRREVEAAL